MNKSFLPVVLRSLVPLLSRAIFIALAGAAASVSVSAQGTLLLNTATGPKPRIVIDGVNAQPSDNIFVQILVSGATSLAGNDTFALKLAGANAGLFSEGTLTVNGKPGGSVVDVTIRAWDKDTGATFETASVRDCIILSRFVLGGIVDANGIPGLPAPIVPAFTGLSFFINSSCVPEPRAEALAILGGGLLLWVKRGKANSRIR